MRSEWSQIRFSASVVIVCRGTWIKQTAIQVKKALKDQADFRVQDMNSRWDGMVGNLRDLKNEGHTEVCVRYSKLNKVTIFAMEDLCK